jgi:hypothetical protein
MLCRASGKEACKKEAKGNGGEREWFRYAAALWKNR